LTVTVCPPDCTVLAWRLREVSGAAVCVARIMGIVTNVCGLSIRMQQLWWLKDNANPLQMVSEHMQEVSPADMKYV